jgi:hypothetical protein
MKVENCIFGNVKKDFLIRVGGFVRMIIIEVLVCKSHQNRIIKI